MITTALDALAFAVGALEGNSIRTVAASLEHLAQLLDDPDQVAEAYRVISMLRSVADAVDAEPPRDE